MGAHAAGVHHVQTLNSEYSFSIPNALAIELSPKLDNPEYLVNTASSSVYFSYQVWQCGGEILIVTCSRVGHVFRKVSPYSWPGGVAQILNHNTQRIASVWMDDYQDFFYKLNPGKCSSEPK